MNDLRSLGARSQAPFDPRVRPVAAGTAAQRPAANLVRADRYGGSFYYETDTRILWYSDGSTWSIVNGPVRLADETKPAAGAQFDFQSIPATFTSLQLVVSGRSDAAAVAVSVYVRFNNDSAATYDDQGVYGNAAAAGAGELLVQNQLSLGQIPASTAGAGIFGSFAVDIPHYAGAVGHKTLLSLNAHKVGRATTNLVSQHKAGFWESSAPINRITILLSGGNFVTGSRATLYGLP